MDRIAFITGVSSGIGYGLTEAYLKSGGRVYGMSRRAPDGISGGPSGAFQFKSVDLAKLEEIPGAVKELLAGVAQIDVAILNAGILGPIADLSETPVAEMQQVMQVNLWANKVLLDAIFAIGIPVAQVVGISSGAATGANRGWNAYAISKAALNMLMGLYAAERPGTHFCALAPGIVDTAMQEKISKMPEDPRFDSLERLRSAKGTPLMPSPQDAAGRLIDGIAKATKYPSGSFLDVRSLVKRGPGG